jgi:hypothetical protein
MRTTGKNIVKVRGGEKGLGVTNTGCDIYWRYCDILNFVINMIPAPFILKKRQTLPVRGCGGP